MKPIGEGSYATVHKYKDPFYNCFFTIKKAKKNLSEIEYQRFQQEFIEIRKHAASHHQRLCGLQCTKNVRR
ncbi:hypothetical protein COK31_11175 [Bacillus cereus]|nr:hypothetical protein COK31_11175 [Bacillus cereus]